MDYQIEEAIIYFEEELRNLRGDGGELKQHYEVAIAALKLALRVKAVIVDEDKGPEENSAEACLRRLYGNKD